MIPALLVRKDTTDLYLYLLYMIFIIAYLAVKCISSGYFVIIVSPVF